MCAWVHACVRARAHTHTYTHTDTQTITYYAQLKTEDNGDERKYKRIKHQ